MKQPRAQCALPHTLSNSGGKHCSPSRNPYGVNCVWKNLIPWPSFFHAWQSVSLKQNSCAQPSWFLTSSVVRPLDQGQLICLICDVNHLVLWLWGHPSLRSCPSPMRVWVTLSSDGLMFWVVTYTSKQQTSFFRYTWKIDLQFVITECLFSLLNIFTISGMYYNCLQIITA